MPYQGQPVAGRLLGPTVQQYHVAVAGLMWDVGPYHVYGLTGWWDICKGYRE